MISYLNLKMTLDIILIIFIILIICLHKNLLEENFILGVLSTFIMSFSVFLSKSKLVNCLRDFRLLIKRKYRYQINVLYRYFFSGIFFPKRFFKYSSKNQFKVFLMKVNSSYIIFLIKVNNTFIIFLVINSFDFKIVINLKEDFLKGLSLFINYDF